MRKYSFVMIKTGHKSKQLWVEESLRYCVEGTSGVVGKSFYPSLVEHLAKAIDVKYVFVGELIKFEQSVRTLSVWAGESIIDNIEYDLEGAPCANVAGKEVCIYPSDLQKRFPDDKLLVDMDVHSYIGAPFFDSHRKTLGLLVAMDDKPMDQDRVDHIKTLLEIFAARAAAEIERVRSEKKMLQSEKLASLGTLVAGIAHEINNPNMFITLNVDTIRDIWADVTEALESMAGDVNISDTEKLSEAKETVDVAFGHVYEGAERIKNIVSDLKNYARDDSLVSAAETDVNEIVKSAVTLTWNKLKNATDHFSADYEDGMPTVLLQGQKLEQVVINLITNACEAMTDRDKAIMVKTSHDSKHRMLIISVEDAGEGMSEEVKSHVFDPFFTTKHDIRGTGLGLAISSRIIDDIGGSIRFDTQPGKGTIVVVAVPLDGKAGK